jgi:hypothetical protein
LEFVLAQSNWIIEKELLKEQSGEGEEILDYGISPRLKMQSAGIPLHLSLSLLQPLLLSTGLLLSMAGRGKRKKLKTTLIGIASCFQL